MKQTHVGTNTNKELEFLQQKKDMTCKSKEKLNQKSDESMRPL